MKVNVSDGHWHTAVVERKKRLGSIVVDGEKPIRVTAGPGATILNSNGKLWIGTVSFKFKNLLRSPVRLFINSINWMQAAAQYSLLACLPRTMKLLLDAWIMPKLIANT